MSTPWSVTLPYNEGSLYGDYSSLDLKLDSREKD